MHNFHGKILMEFKEFLNEANHGLTSVYHVSPRSDMFKLRPTSHHKGTRALIGKGEPGIFVAPKFRDAIAWSVSYVAGKKYNTQEPTERVKEKGGGRHGEKFKGNYATLTIYEIEVPKDVLKRSVYTGWWEPEYFISASDMELMNIISSKTYSFYELVKIQSRLDNTKKTFEPQGDSGIIDIRKTNLAARYYLELKDTYNNHLLKGKSPLIAPDDPFRSSMSSDHLVNLEIEKLKKYMFQNTPDWKVIPITSLNKTQEKEVETIYKRIKSMIESL